MGTMRERTPGTWELVVSTGRDPATGRYRRVIRTLRTTSKREAKAALAKLEVEVAAGQVSALDLTLGELFERWLEHIAGLGRSDSTLYNYRKFIRRDINPRLGAMRLSKLSARDIDGLYSALTARGLAPATVRQIHAILRAALNQAERWGLVGRNVAKLASAPSQPQREQHPPTPEEVQALIVAAVELEPQFGVYVRLVAATGMRRAEACGLRWSDVDFDDGRLTIERSHLSLPGINGDRPTKTRTARRISLDPGTVEVLRSAWAAALEVATFCGVNSELRRAGYLFSFDPQGLIAWRGDVVSARWSRTREAAGVRRTIRLHDLRHWQATQLLDSGVPVPTVAARLGHVDGTTTMKIYAHRTERADGQAAAIVGNVLDGPAVTGI